MPQISFPVEVIEGVPVVTAPEEIDIANAPLLQKALAEASGPGQVLVVVDMSRTRFCDSAGLNALVTADRQVRAEGGEVRLVITGESVVRIVALTGVDQVIEIYVHRKILVHPHSDCFHQRKMLENNPIAPRDLGGWGALSGLGFHLGCLSF